MELGSLAEWVSGLTSASAVIVALWLARKSTKDQAHDRLAGRRATGRRILSDVRTIANSIYSIRSQIEVDLEGLTPPQPSPNERWCFVKPLFGLTEADAIYIDPGSMDLLMEADPKLYEAVGSVASQQRVLVRLLAEYGRRRDALFGMLPPPIEADGAYLIGVISDAPEYANSRAHAMAVEALLTEVWEAAEEALPTALDVSERLGPAMRKFLPDPKFPMLGRVGQPKE